MSFLDRLRALVACLIGLALSAPAAAGPTCHGRFPNPVTQLPSSDTSFSPKSRPLARNLPGR